MLKSRSLVPLALLLGACMNAGTVSSSQDAFADARERMVAEQIGARDVRESRVLAAMREVQLWLDR